MVSLTDKLARSLFNYLDVITLAAFGARTLPTVVILAALFGCLSLAVLGDVLYDRLMSRHKAWLPSLRRRIRKAECANGSRGSQALRRTRTL